MKILAAEHRYKLLMAEKKAPKRKAGDDPETPAEADDKASKAPKTADPKAKAKSKAKAKAKAKAGAKAD